MTPRKNSYTAKHKLKAVKYALNNKTAASA